MGGRHDNQQRGSYGSRTIAKDTEGEAKREGAAEVSSVEGEVKEDSKSSVRI